MSVSDVLCWSLACTWPSDAMFVFVWNVESGRCGVEPSHSPWEHLTSFPVLLSFPQAADIWTRTHSHTHSPSSIKGNSCWYSHGTNKHDFIEGGDAIRHLYYFKGLLSDFCLKANISFVLLQTCLTMCFFFLVFFLTRVLDKGMVLWLCLQQNKPFTLWLSELTVSAQIRSEQRPPQSSI